MTIAATSVNSLADARQQRAETLDQARSIRKQRETARKAQSAFAEIEAEAADILKLRGKDGVDMSTDKNKVIVLGYVLPTRNPLRHVWGKESVDAEVATDSCGNVTFMVLERTDKMRSSKVEIRYTATPSEKSGRITADRKLFWDDWYSRETTTTSATHNLTTDTCTYSEGKEKR